eukprot:TRINITY_DN70385_c0_g1_i1.p1 TRINITY_DN70385_c0_g1~~TRINITY_DN70385_c0_g1_i1.p1  ORF type:complete len:302 (+),score=93.09 TRINITY_DN70385_c0_g1_i1:1-906(+)
MKSIPHGFILNEGFVNVGSEKIKKMALRQDDVWIITPPKCGTTWMQELSWCVGHDVDLETAKQVVQFYRSPFLDFNRWGQSEEGEDADIYKLEKNKENVMTFMHNSFEYIESMESPRFIKTHLPLCFLPEDLLKNCKVIYVARNVKDVCVSWFYHQKQPAPFDQFAKAFRNGEMMPGNWFEHMKQAWEVREEDNMEFVWYEDMKEDIRGVIGKIANHLGKTMTEDDMKALVKHLDIDQFKANSSVNKTQEMPSTGDRPSFIRKGIVGDWKNHFTQEESKEWDSWITSELERTGIQGMRGWE